MLVVLRDSGKRVSKKVYWECQCDCGNIVVVRGTNLKNGHTKSCGCFRNKRENRVIEKAIIKKATLSKMGLKINKLTIIDFVKEIKKPLKVKLQCECGNTVIKDYHEFMRGKIKSCGCLQREISENAKIKREQTTLLKEQRRLNSINRHPEFKLVKDFAGTKWGKLTVLYFCGVRIKKSGIRNALWFCKCDCGEYTIKTSTAFSVPNISCGCFYKKNQKQRAINLSNKKRAKVIELIGNGYINREDIDHKHRRIRTTIRNLSFLKWGDQCLICDKSNSKEKPICIHHLKPHWLFPKLRYFIANLIPLCRICHDKLHKTLGYETFSILSQKKFIKNSRSNLKLSAQPLIYFHK